MWCAVSKERDEKGFRVETEGEKQKEKQARWRKSGVGWGRQAEESKNQLASLNPGLGGRNDGACPSFE